MLKCVVAVATSQQGHDDEGFIPAEDPHRFIHDGGRVKVVRLELRSLTTVLRRRLGEGEREREKRERGREREKRDRERERESRIKKVMVLYLYIE